MKLYVEGAKKEEKEPEVGFKLAADDDGDITIVAILPGNVEEKIAFFTEVDGKVTLYRYAGLHHERRMKLYFNVDDDGSIVAE